jgi:hypothetical protein
VHAWFSFPARWLYPTILKTYRQPVEFRHRRIAAFHAPSTFWGQQGTVREGFLHETASMVPLVLILSVVAQIQLPCSGTAKAQ